MSTQKREHGITAATTTRREGARCRSQLTKSTHRAGVGCFPLPAQIARYVCAAAKGSTAPLVSILWSTLAWVATKFLHSDHHIGQLVRPVFKADRRGSPPLRVQRRAALGKQASPRSSIPHIPYPSGIEPSHLTSPNDPIARFNGRRAERYDGKRDMYFQHAA